MPQNSSQPRDARQGDIVWLRVQGSRGRITEAPHAVVVITPDEHILAGQPLHGVGVTSTPHRDVSPDVLVELPWHRDRHPVTGLNRRCYAVCNWLVRFEASDAGQPQGQVPAEHLREILRKISQLGGAR